MKAFSKILIPTDFSKASRRATEYAIDFLEGKPTELIFLNSYEPPHMGSGMLISINDILEKESLSGLKKEMMWLEREGKLNGHSCKTLTGKGQPIDVINSIGENQHADAIFIGNNGASGFKKALYGSNTGEIIGSSTLPVFSIPHESTYNGIKTMCLSYDGKAFENPNILPELERLRSMKNAQLTVFHTRTPKNEKFKERVEKNLEAFKEHIPADKLKVDIIESQYSDDGLRSYFDENTFDLICMVPRNESFLEKFLPSQTQNMASIAKNPLWTFHD